MSRIAIIGAGINGLTLAIALSKLGFKSNEIILYEKADKARAEGTGIIFWSEIISMLKLLDVDLKHVGVGLPFLKTIFLAGDDLSEFNIQNKGQEAHGFLREHIYKTLHKKVNALGISLKTGYECLDVESKSDHCIVKFKDKENVEADIVIGADGINSSVRQSVFSHIKPLSLDIQAYRGIYKANGNTVTDRQLPTNACHIYCGVNWRIVFYPNYKDKDTIHYYWFAGFRQDIKGQPKVAIQQSETVTKKEIENLILKLPNCPSNIQKLIRETDLNCIINSPTLKQMPMFDYNYDRVALLGDAAHAMAPTVALGFLLGIINTLHLASQMKKYKTNLPRALSEYRKVVKSHSKSCLNYTHELTNLYYADKPMDTATQAKETYNDLYQLISNAASDGISAYLKALGLEQEEIIYH